MGRHLIKKSKKPNQYSNKFDEQLCICAWGIFKENGHLTSLDYELLTNIYNLEAFYPFICDKKGITVKTDCEAIIKYHQ